MTRPVKDHFNPDHFLKPAAIRMYTIDKGLSFDDLKKELPELKIRPGTSDEHNADADVKKDQENRKVWRGNCVRCDECGFVRCIYSEYA